MYLDAKEIKKNNIGSQTLYDNSNTVTYYHNLNKGKYKNISRTKFIDNLCKKQYVKSPLTLLHDVEAYTKKLDDIIHGRRMNHDNGIEQEEIIKQEIIKPMKICNKVLSTNEEFCDESPKAIESNTRCNSPLLVPCVK